MIPYFKLGFCTVDGADRDDSMHHTCNNVLSLIWALIWAGVALSFAHPPVTPAAERPPSALHLQELWRFTSPGAQVNQTGPFLPPRCYLTRLEPTAAWPGPSACRSPSPATVTCCAGKGLNPWELARRVSVTTLNTQGDSGVAPGGARRGPRGDAG